jgi:molybdenum cofactor cytidylyltransferase
MIAAIILAAGKSQRMGRPKALLAFQGTTFIHRILETIKTSPLAPVIVVLGSHREEIERAIPLETCAFNPDYEQGMITSLQTGIRSLPADSDGALLFLVDHPVTSPQTIGALLSAFKPRHIVLPTFNGRRGHPVLFSRTVLDEILELPPSSGANRVVWKDPSRVVEVPVDDGGILIDVDTPDQYGKLS